jgi:hypothetical protein
MKQNLIYLLTNINKSEGKRFYIGSKQEATLECFDGVMTILDRNNKPYYSSSSSFEMKEEMKRGDIFEASLLEWVPDRRNLLEIENKYIMEKDAVKSDNYYNMSYALMNCHDQEAVANKFGETIKELACRNSSLSKRDNTAKKLGFNNFGELHLWVKQKKDEGFSHGDMSELIGKHRCFSKNIIEGIDLEKAYLEIENSNIYQDKLRSMIACGCSLYYAAELLKLELPSARIIIGDYNKEMERAYRCALKVGLSKDELEKRVVQIILNSKDGEGYKDAARELKIGTEAVRRYLARYLKKNLSYPEL